MLLVQVKNYENKLLSLNTGDEGGQESNQTAEELLTSASVI